MSATELRFGPLLRRYATNLHLSMRDFHARLATRLNPCPSLDKVEHWFQPNRYPPPLEGDLLDALVRRSSSEAQVLRRVPQEVATMALFVR